jgi:hypothetical protein
MGDPSHRRQLRLRKRSVPAAAASASAGDHIDRAAGCAGPNSGGDQVITPDRDARRAGDEGRSGAAAGDSPAVDTAPQLNLPQLSREFELLGVASAFLHMHAQPACL